MAKLLKGAPAAAALNEQSRSLVRELEAAGITPTLAVLRVGANEDDLSYERGLKKRADELGIRILTRELPETVSPSDYYGAITDLADDISVHGILLFMPLPESVDGSYARSLIPPDKDVDCCTETNLGKIFTGIPSKFIPCTAQAAIEILKYYGIPLAGANACIIGRSLVVGKPLSMLLLNENASVSICHSKTADAAAISKTADIIVAACGRLRMVDASYIKEGAAVIDVGIHYDEASGKLAGDVDYDSASRIAGAITPVPGGVGSVTTAVLMRHVIEAARAKLS